MPDSQTNAHNHELEVSLKSSQKQLQIITSIAAAAAERGSPGHIIRRSLEIIARANDWVVGQYWTVDATTVVLTCSDHLFSAVPLLDFRTSSLDRRFSMGVGLPGRVWATNLPYLIDDISMEKQVAFPRREVAIKSGLKSGFGFGAKSGPFTAGIFEFFSFDDIKITSSDSWFYEKLGIYIATIMSQEESTEKLFQKELWYKAIINNCSQAFIAIDHVSVITDWSERAKTLFGWEKEEVLGKTISDVIIPERYRQGHIQGLFRYMTTKEGPILQKRIKAPALTKEGKETMVELFIFPIEGKNSQGFGAFIIDLSKPAPQDHDISLT